MRRFKGIFIGLIATGLMGSNAFAGTWEFDEAHSTGAFTVRHMMISNVSGQIVGLKGKVELDDKDVSKSKVDVTLDPKTINTNHAKRDEHLRSPDFFDVAKFPTIHFVGTKVDKAGEGKLKVSGALTMHGVTKDVVLDVEGPTAPSKDPWGNVKRGVSATAKVNRKDFGLTWNKNLDGGGVVVGDEIKISLEIELNESKGETGDKKK